MAVTLTCHWGADFCNDLLLTWPNSTTDREENQGLRLKKTWNSCTILFTDKTGYWWGSSALESVWVFDNKLLVRSLAISGFLGRREGSGVRRSAGYLFWLDAGDVLKAREAALWRWQESNNCLSPRDTWLLTVTVVQLNISCCQDRNTSTTLMTGYMRGWDVASSVVFIGRFVIV